MLVETGRRDTFCIVVGALRRSRCDHRLASSRSESERMSTRTPYAAVLLPALLLATSCSSGATARARQTGDASTSTGGSGGSATSMGSGGSSGSSGSSGATGSSGTTGSSGGTTPDASLDGSSADACDTRVVSNVVRSRGPETSAEAGSPALIQRIDGGFLHITPTDPCVTYVRPDCPGSSIFGCPSVTGPNGSTTIHPGNQITVKVPVTDEGLAAYSCNGLGTDQDLVGGSELFYAVKPAYVEESGQVPASAKPGTLYHFTAVASGSRYTSGTACENDLTRLDFDVTVE